MIRPVCFIVTMLLCLPMVCGAQRVQGTLLSAYDRAPVPYALVVDIDSKVNGTTSDSLGRFSLPVRTDEMRHRILISSLGFQDTIINISDLENNQVAIILLNVQSWSLPMVDVIASIRGRNSFVYGDPEGKIRLDPKGAAIGISSESAGFSRGVMITPSKSHAGGMLTSLSVFITSEGVPSHPFLIRFLECPHGMRPKQGESSDQFHGMNVTPIIFSAEKMGWNEMDLRPYNLIVPPSPFLVMFVPIDKGISGKWLKGSGYGAAIGIYNQPNIRSVYEVLKVKAEGWYAYSNKELFGLPAVVIRGTK